MAGGLPRAVERAVELECTALQIFTQAPGRWSGRAISSEEAEEFRVAVDDAGLSGVVFAHTPYLINVASGSRDLWRRSVELLKAQLVTAQTLGWAGVVLHPGAHGGDGVGVGLDRATRGLATAIEDVPEAPPVLVETTAGAGTVLGASADEVGRLTESLPADRIGVCWDTAHLWAAGYDISEDQGWDGVWRLFVGAAGRPSLLHLNDTGVELGSRKDRHARIGHGRLGEATFARVLNDPRCENVPMVLETPKGEDGVSWDRQALQLLRCLVGEST